MAWNDNLAGDHLNIAGSNNSPLRVLAGPGTGKTFALMRRISRLLEQGANPRRILVSTFTRTAAKDLESSLAQLGSPGVGQVRAGTLHSLSFSILSRAEVLEITGRNPRPLMEFEQRFLIEDLCHSSALNVRDCKEKLRAFNAAWARLQQDQPGWLAAPGDRAFDIALRGWLVFHQTMLIGELVPECRRYLNGNPECTERRAFDHVLVDEYQDLNRAEQEVLDLLAANGTLTVIGDENQSIYSFKHAHPEGIVNFNVTHANTTNHSLTVCQRCPQKLVEMSNALLVAGDPDARQLTFDPNKPAAEVHIVQWSSIQEEAMGIAAMIRRRIDTGALRPGEVLVLAQRRQFGYAIRDALAAVGVPAHSFFSEQELDGNPMKAGEHDAQRAFTLLTLLASPNDPVALRSWCGFGSTSLRAGGWSKIVSHSRETGISIRAILERLADDKITLSHTKPVVNAFKQLCAAEQECAGLVGRSLLDAVFPPAAEWSEPLRTLAESVESDDYPAIDLLEAVRSGITQPEMPVETTYVRIMSLHKSKGLTADFVAVAGLVEGIVPSAPDDRKTPEEQARKLQEDRRVFYVAITRARKILLLSSVINLPIDIAMKMRALGRNAGGVVRTHPSRFLDQLGPTAPHPIAGRDLPA